MNNLSSMANIQYEDTIPMCLKIPWLWDIRFSKLILKTKMSYNSCLLLIRSQRSKRAHWGPRQCFHLHLSWGPTCHLCCFLWGFKPFWYLLWTQSQRPRWRGHGNGWKWSIWILHQFQPEWIPTGRTCGPWRPAAPEAGPAHHSRT